MLENYFNYKKHKTDFKTEVIAGTTTFLTMAYIMFLNPFILSGEFAGPEKGFFDFGAVYTATILATALACFIMAFYGKTWPIGLAPGMGINAFVAFGVCAGMGYTPQEALGAVLVAGVLFLIISLTPIRAWLINSIPKSLKLGIGAGIGLFLAIIGLQIMEVVVDDPVTLVKLGDLSNPLVLLGCATFIAIVVLEKMNVKGNIIIGILVFSIIAWTAGLANFNGIASSPPPMTYLFEFDLSAALTAGMSTVIFTLLFIDFFDTAGTLTSVANVAGKVDKQGKVQDINKAMLSDSVGTVAGAMMGTTTVTSYVESGAGVKAGGKTGMTSLVIGLLFLACIFFAPLATSLPKQIDGAALLFVSVLFVRNITDIEWDDIGESAPAILAMIAMPLTYSISNGIASSPPPMTYLFEFDLSAAMTAGMSTVIFTLLFIDFFDTAGTLTSVANVAGKVGKDGKVQDINKAMLSDSVGTVAGAMMGTTTVTSYVESGAGVKAGGKTGMTSLVIGLLFLACIFFAPLATSLPKQIDGAALLFVSVLFIRNITDIEWDDIAESAPAILAMIAMPLTYSISNGIALAFVSYALIKLFTGKFSSTSPAIWVIAILSVISFVVA